MRSSFSPFRAAGMAVAFLIATLASGELAAQSDGTPIRLQTAAKPGKWITGRSAGITADSVSIIPDTTSDTLRFAKSELQRLDVSQGRKSSAGRGALIGGAIGGGVMLALGIACVADTNEGDIVGCEGGDVPLFALMGAAGGAAVGALIGATGHHEQWKAVQVGPPASGSP